VARPSKYETHVAPRLTEIEDWVRNGATDKEVWERLGISKDSFYEYKKQFSEFSDSLKKSKDFVDAQVENALLKRALGYEYQEMTQEITADGKKHIKKVTKQVFPDTIAAIFWLKNRRPDKWRDKPMEQEVVGKDDGIVIEIRDYSDESNHNT